MAIAAGGIASLTLVGASQPLEQHLFDAVRLTAHIDTPKAVACHVGSAMLIFEKNGVEFFAPPDNLPLGVKLAKKEALWEIHGDNCVVQLDVKILTPQGPEHMMEETPFDNDK